MADGRAGNAPAAAGCRARRALRPAGCGSVATGRGRCTRRSTIRALISCSGWWITSPRKTARRSPERAWITTFPGVWPGAGSNHSPSSRAKSSSTSCDCPVRTTGNTLSSNARPVRRVLALFLRGFPMVVFAPRHHIAGVWKGRDPAAVFELGVPADMVPVQMGAHDKIDPFRPDPGACQIGEIAGAHAVELRAGRALLVVAETGNRRGSCDARS